MGNSFTNNIKNIKDHINIESNDELIDMDVYNKNTVNMLLTYEDLKEILCENGSNNLSHIYLSDAFRYIRNDNIFDFRKLIQSHKSLINTKFRKTYLIHEACKKGLPEFVKFLLFFDARCDMEDEYGKLPAHYAIESKCSVLIDILSLFGNNMNVQDKNGDTPFHYAVKINNLDMINTLMIYKANPKLENKKNKSPLDSCHNKNIINILRQYIKSDFT